MRIEARPFVAPCHHPPAATTPSTASTATPATEHVELERVKLAKPTTPIRCPAPVRDPGPPDPPPRVGSASRGVVVGLLRGIGSFFSGLFGVPRAVGHGLVDAGRALFRGQLGAAFAAIGTNIAGGIMGAALGLAAGVVTAMRKGGRPLTGDEAITLRKALGPKVRTDRIRIVEDGGILNRGNSAITIGHTIFVSKKALPLALDLLVHEATHTTQFDELGPGYLAKALGAQHDSEGYDFRKALARGATFETMNLESQAEFLQQIEASGVDLDDPKARLFVSPWGPPVLSGDPGTFGGQGVEVTGAARAARTHDARP